jgi:hypothetical protein
MRRRLIPAIGFMLLGVLSGCVVAGGCSPSTRFEVKGDLAGPATVSAGTALRVTTDNGHIHVRQGAGPMAVHWIAFASDEQRAGQIRPVVTETPSGIEIGVAWPGARQSGDRCSIEITVPAVAEVTLRSANGALEVRDVGAAADLETSNGAVVVEGVPGKVRVESQNGRLTLSRVGGSVTAETSNGVIEVALTPENAGPVMLKSQNGRVGLTFGAGLRGKIAAKTQNGSLTTEGLTGANAPSKGSKSMTIDLGEGPDSSVTTSNGNIVIRRTP